MRAAPAIALLFVLASCGGAPRALRPGTLSARQRPSAPHTGCELAANDEPRICAVAVLDDAAGVMDVTLRIEPAALPARRREVALGFRPDVFGERYVEEFVDVVDRPAWPRSLGAVREPVEIHYRVSLEFFERGRPIHGRSGISWRRPGGWHLTGRTFLPDIYVDGQRAAIAATLDLDVGALPLWTAAGNEQRLFDAPDLVRLADEAYEVGPLTTTRLEAGSTVLWLGVSGELEGGSLEVVADVLSRAMSSLSTRLGPPSTDSALVVFHPIDEPIWAERLGSSLVQVGREGLPRDALYGLSSGALPELAHLWNPGMHTIAETWLEEGVNDYLALMTMADLSAAPSSSTARTILRSHARYAEGAQRRTLRQETNGSRWAYDAGMVAGYCLDGHLRTSRSSLGAVLRVTLARDEAQLGAETLLEDIAALSPSSASYLDALLGSVGAFAIDDCLQRHGLRKRDVTYNGWSDRALAIDVLGIVALSSFTHAQAFSVEEPAEGSHFERGDIVLAIENHPVADLADIAWVLRDVRAGERIRVTYRRRGAVETAQLTFPALDRDRREARMYVDLSEQPASR